MKTCGGCKEDRPFEEFGRNIQTKDGWRSECKPCTTARSIRSTVKKRRMLADLKLERGCTDCGYNAHPDALEFDHLPQYKKSFTIGSALANKGIDNLLAEVAKCEVVCSNCHRVRSAIRREDALDI